VEAELLAFHFRGFRIVSRISQNSPKAKQVWFFVNSRSLVPGPPRGIAFMSIP